jgi:hypothetical protein
VRSTHGGLLDNKLTATDEDSKPTEREGELENLSLVRKAAEIAQQSSIFSPKGSASASKPKPQTVPKRATEQIRREYGHSLTGTALFDAMAKRVASGEASLEPAPNTAPRPSQATDGAPGGASVFDPGADPCGRPHTAAASQLTRAEPARVRSAASVAAEPPRVIFQPPPGECAAPGPSAYECEQREIEQHRDGGEWKRHKPQQPSVHRSSEQFGQWVDKSTARATDDPSAIGSLVAARAMAPALLEPRVPEGLRQLAAEQGEHFADEYSVDAETGEITPRAPAAKLTRRERRQWRTSEQQFTERAMRLDAAMVCWANKWLESGNNAASMPPVIDPTYAGMCRAIVCNEEAANDALTMIGQSWGGGVLWRVMRWSFGEVAAPRWDTRKVCTRRKVALAVFMLTQARLKMAGRNKYGRAIMQPCVWGIGRGYIQWILGDPDTGAPLSRERLTHSNDTCTGLFHGAEGARFFARQSRIPQEFVERDEVGPSGHTFNRYWVAGVVNLKPALKPELDGLSPQDASDAAWAWMDAGVRAALRGRFLGPTDSVDQKWVAREKPPP